VTVTPALIGNFKTKYGPFIDALPEPGTMAARLPFTQKAKIGEKYQISFLAADEHGQTASNAGGLFTLNAAIGAEIPRAEIAGTTIMERAQFAWDDVYASLNGGESSYDDIMSIKLKSMGRTAALYREIALVYGPGTGSVLASNIGVVSTTGAALSTSPTIRLTRASYIAGLWQSMRNALVDIYQSDGTTLRVSDVQVVSIGNQNKTHVKLFKTGSAVTPTANDVIIPKGWKGQACLGLESIMSATSGTVFNVDISLYGQFKTPIMDAASGPLTRKLIREWAARVRPNGSTSGGDLLCSGSAFAGLAEEFSALNRDTTMGGVKKQGESKLVFETPAGDISVEIWDQCKQGEAFYFAKTSNPYRVGTTDNTMRPIKGMNEGFLTPLIDQAGCQACTYANFAPFVEQPWHNFLVQNIVSPGDALDVA
jgi:hypothetical protein